MINWIIGSSGGGKTYEAVRYHILPALERGRHVITNLPLIMEAFEQLYPEYVKQLHLRKTAMPELGKFHIIEQTPTFDLYTDGYKIDPPVGQIPFSKVWDYYTPPEYLSEDGRGPLFVIDECQFPLPYKKTDELVEGWFSMHRHFNGTDVLLLTQSYGKISQAIRDNTQVVHYVRKNIAFGSSKTYTKKVKDGFRGDVVNTKERFYEKKYFPLYKSHTQGDTHEEYGADDITPLWLRWPFIGTGICAFAFVIMLFTMDFQNPLSPQTKLSSSYSPNRSPVEHANNLNLSALQTEIDIQPTPDVLHLPADVLHLPGDVLDKPPELLPKHPLSGKNLHIIGHIKGIFNGQHKDAWMFTVSQNAQKAFDLNLSDLESMGYQFNSLSDCVAIITYGEFQETIICDAPSHNVTLGGTQT